MLIQRDQVIVGRPATEVRAMMRTLCDVAHSTRALAEQFGLDDATARQLVDGLRGEGFIEVSEMAGHYAIGVEEDETARRPLLWSTTIAGTALAKARIGVPMQRVKAQALLDGVLDRVVEVNDSDDWLHWVIEVVLYGSFARDGEGPVGDVDVAVHLKARYPHEVYMRLQRER